MTIIEERAKLTPEMLVDEYVSYKTHRLHGRSIANANWVTTLAHPCRAYAVYMRTVPADQRRKMKDSLGMIFSEGDDQARAIKRDLLDMGWDVEGAEAQLSWPNFQITGRQDLKLRKPGYPSVHAEIKSCSPFTYASINCADDIWGHKWSFIQKWAYQVSLYMVLKSVENYWLILKDKSSGRIKVVEFNLGSSELIAAEGMIQKATETNKLVQIGGVPSPDMKLSEPDVCGECEFFSVCLPELTFGVGARVLTDEMASELSDKTTRLHELKPLAKEYEDLDEEVKAQIKELASDDVNDVVFGDWIAKVKRIARKAFSVAAGTQQRVTFVRVSSKD